ncbi:autotransporter outer membrane beta-barrel domain-containing protein [Mesorhizobium xinjiangense]|uniref:hypothetical protein n=1 Tax=Mesorhizobium xinjiangense TaxID=2678685 RepID=UPI0018DBC409|nr:hypothetical protein [Mesorhizobium xinjiangense]
MQGGVLVQSGIWPVLVNSGATATFLPEAGAQPGNITLNANGSSYPPLDVRGGTALINPNQSAFDTILNSNGTTATGSYGILAPFGYTGSTIEGYRVRITTVGPLNYGVFAGGSGSRITLRSSSITTSGANSNANGAYGFLIYPNATGEIYNSTILTTGPAGSGVVVTGGGLTAENVAIETQGPAVLYNGYSYGAMGINVQSGGVATVTDGSVRTLQDYGVGMRALSRSSLTASGTVVTTDGAQAHGVYAAGSSSAAATASLTGLTISTGGTHGYGLRVDGAGSTLGLVNGSIATTGLYGHGALPYVGGQLTLDGTGLVTAGTAADGIYSYGGTANVTDSSVGTTGQTSHGVNVTNGGAGDLVASMVSTQGAGAFGLRAAGTGSAVSATSTTVVTSGDDAVGVSAQDEAAASIAGTAVTTTGAGAHGVLAVQSGLVELLPGSTEATVVDTTGAGAHGALVESGGTLNGTDATIHARGAGSDGLSLQEATGGFRVDGLVNAPIAPANPNEVGPTSSHRICRRLSTPRRSRRRRSRRMSASSRASVRHRRPRWWTARCDQMGASRSPRSGRATTYRSCEARRAALRV